MRGGIHSIVFLVILLLGAPFSASAEKTGGKYAFVRRGIAAVKEHLGRVDEHLSALLEKINTRTHDTIGSIFGLRPFADGTFEFEVPRVFSDITVDQFANWYNGIIPEKEDEDLLAKGNHEESAVMELVQESIGENDGDGEEDGSVPEEYDFFKEYPMCLKEATDQSRCGSCYAFATSNSLSHRLCKEIEDTNRKRNWDEHRLSPQPIISCAGSSVCPNKDEDGSPDCCRGGYIRGAAAWVSNNYLSPMECFEYESWHGGSERGRCEKEKKDCAEQGSLKKVKSSWGTRKDPMFALKTTVSKFKHVRGTVQAIKAEIAKNGPIAATIKTASNLIGYNGKGIFTRGNAPWLAKGQTHSYHAWVIYGYDKDSWLVENSWGDIYSKRPKGLRHTLRVKMGTNELMMESLTKIAMTPAVWKGDKKLSIAEGWPKMKRSAGKEAALAVGNDVESASNGNDIKLIGQAKRVIEETKKLLKDEGLENVSD